MPQNGDTFEGNQILEEETKMEVDEEDATLKNGESNEDSEVDNNRVEIERKIV